MQLLYANCSTLFSRLLKVLKFLNLNILDQLYNLFFLVRECINMKTDIECNNRHFVKFDFNHVWFRYGLENNEIIQVACEYQYCIYSCGG